MADKPMNKILKYILVAGGVVVGLFVLLLAVAAIIIPIKYPPEKLKAMAMEKLSAATKHKVTIGDVHFSVFSGFEITDLKVGNRPGWDPRPLLSAKDISISYHLLPLLWGEVSLGEIKLNQPDILVEKRPGGQFNFSDMTADASAAAPAPPAQPKTAPKTKGKPKGKKKSSKHAAAPAQTQDTVAFSFFASPAWAESVSAAKAPPAKASMAFSVDSFNIVHAKMVYLDESVSPRQESDLSDLNLSAKGISTTGGKTTFSIETPVTYTKLQYQLRIDGAFRYNLAAQSLKELSVKGAVNDLGFGVSGDIEDLTGNLTPKLDGNASLNMLKFSGLVPRNLYHMPDDLSLTGPAEVNFHLAGSKKAGLELSGTADGSELAIQYKDLFVKTAKSACKVEFSTVNKMDQGEYDVPSFKVTYGDWAVTGSFYYKGGSFSGEVHSKDLPLGGLPGMIPEIKKATVTGSGSMDIKFSKAANDPNSLKTDGKVTLKGIGVEFPQQPYVQDLEGTILLEGNVVRAPGVTFKGFDGTGAIGVTYAINTQAVQFKLDLKGVDAQKAVNANYPSMKDTFYGTMNFSYAGALRGFTTDKIIASSTGSGNYSILNARVKAGQFLGPVNKYLKNKIDEMDMDKMDGVLAMKDKVLTFTMNATGKAGALRSKGGVQMVQMAYTPDLEVQNDIKRDFIDSGAVQANFGALNGLVKTPDFIVDDNGNVPLDFKFTGKVSENHYSWDTGRLQSVVRKHAGAAVQNAVKQGAQNLGNQLKGLFH